MGARAEPAPDDSFASSLRGFGPLGLLSFFVILLGNALLVGTSGVLVLAWARLSRTPWRDLGLVRPRSWPVTIVAGIVSGAAFKLVMKSVVLPLLGADPINHAYHYLAHNDAALPFAIYAMIVGAGFGEEMVFRGYLFERIGKRYGQGSGAKLFAIALTSVFFGVAHYRVQGLAGAEQATITGLVFGTIYAASGRIWLPMIAHAAFDLTALWIIYHDLETSVAHWFFR